VSDVPAAIVLAAVAAAALLADRAVPVAALAIVLLALSLRARRPARWFYVSGAIVAGATVFVLSPLLATEGAHILWNGPVLPVLGPLDVTDEELSIALTNGLRLTAVALAFSAYVLLLEHERLLQAAGFARRSSVMVALATRLVPTLERDAAGFVEALRGRGIALSGIRGRARLLSPLVAASLERALNLAEAMEARGFGRPGATRMPRAPWTALDRAALLGAGVLLVAFALWL
jgi:energy-coupling factor transport system permease protein